MKDDVEVEKLLKAMWARSSLANNLIVLIVISVWVPPKPLTAGIWEAMPTLSFLSYWAFPPTSSAYVCSPCSAELIASPPFTDKPQNLFMGKEIKINK